MKITNKIYNINGNINTKLVLISDIHYYNKSNIKVLNKILDLLRKINPNYICIPGDIIDNSNILDEKYLIEWLRKLANISKVIISVGNHEYYIDKKNNKFGANIKLMNKIKKIENVYYLDNKSIVIDNINFVGVTMPIEYYMTEGEKIESFNNNFNFNLYKKNKYNILLLHSPSNLLDKTVINKLKYDLILCGHTHGGIVPKVIRPILRNRGLINPQGNILSKNCYGFINKKPNILVTSGITTLSYENPFSIFNKLFSPEVVTINIED